MTSSSGWIVSSVSRFPPTMKKISPDSACGDEPSIGVSMCVRPFGAAASWIVRDTSGLTVEQSQVTRPRRAPARMPSGPR
jgi:hypothetical protein